ncbi:hypothetical protein ACEPAH_1563 [Sanghuangporus vaninii]
MRDVKEGISVSDLNALGHLATELILTLKDLITFISSAEALKELAIRANHNKPREHRVHAILPADIPRLEAFFISIADELAFDLATGKTRMPALRRLKLDLREPFEQLSSHVMLFTMVHSFPDIQELDLGLRCLDAARLAPKSSYYSVMRYMSTTRQSPQF